jgi:inositol-phosphate transport system permease protein
MVSRRSIIKYFTIAIMLLPAVLTLAMFLVTPAALTILISLTNLDYRFKWEWIGLANYYQFLLDPVAPIIIKNTIIFVAGVLLFNIIAGLGLALLSTHVHDSIGTFLRAAWYLPRILPSVTWTFAMMWFFSPLDTGVLNSILKSMGLEPVPWTFKYYWLFLILVTGFMGCSLGMVIYSSAIKSIPPELIIAAKIDGASGLTLVRRIILPLIKWHIAFVIAYQTLSFLGFFEYILLTLDGGPGFYSTEVLALYAYHIAFGTYFAIVRYSYAAVCVMIILIISLALSIIYWKIFRLGKLMLEPKLE